MRNILSGALCALLLASVGCTGIVVGQDFNTGSQAVHSLGAQLVRVEFPIGASCSSMEPAMTAYANNGGRVVALAGFDLRDRGLPSQSEAQSVAQWAQCFGPDSTWASQHDGFALGTVEFGNETSYNYQANCGSGSWWATSCLQNIAQTYGLRAHQAKAALGLAGNGVQLLVQGDDGGSGNVAWVHNIKVGGLVSSDVAGWTVHPYGVSPQTKLGNLVNFTAAEGFSNTIGVYPTEYGISSQECNGSPVFMAGDAQGWGNQLTYSQAAADLNQGMDAIRSFLGDRLGAIFIYHAHDGVPACTSTNRESFFGALTSSLGNKGAYSAEVRDQLTQ